MQQQGFQCPNIMGTSQTHFVPTQGFEPNMIHTSQDVTSFGQTPIIPSTIYDQSNESHKCLIPKFQEKMDKKVKKLEKQIENVETICIDTTKICKCPIESFAKVNI